jgi:glutamate/tyrosine decarboxylase-like PLP-dependent enzyme
MKHKTEELISKIRDLETKSEFLEPDTSERKSILNQLEDYTTRFYGQLKESKAFNNDTSVTDKLEINDSRHSLEQILELYRDLVEKRGVNPASGGHLGYIPGGGLFLSAAAVYLVDITNDYAGVYFASPGAVSIEEEVLNWLKKLFRFPDSAVGNLASGGSMANLIALTAARDKHKVKGSEVEKCVVYLTSHVHHCIDKALRIIGLEDVIVREVKLDKSFRMDAKDLNDLISVDLEKGLRPFLIIASAGTTDTGAMDPLNALADIAEEKNLWFHIDAAYGGFFILSKTKLSLFDGIERADSLVVDPHKGLFLPYGVGAVLIKDVEAVTHSHRYSANYMQDTFLEDVPMDPANLSPELTKHFRGMRVWLPLQYHGIDPFIACLDEKLLLLDYFREQLVNMGFKVGPQPDLSVSFFWWPLENSDEDSFNQKLMELIHADGSVFLSSSTIGGRFVIRIAILAFRTKLHTVDRALEMIQRCLNRLLEK